jgi:uncharacterized membrane protein
MISKRDHFIDFLRAVAILLMFFAHLLPHFSATGLDAIFVLRLLSSFPAPLFLLLTGLNFSENQVFKEVLYKSLVFLGVGAIIDVVIWGIIPFYSFDVFYVIGLGYLLLYFYSKWRLFWQIVALCSIVLITIFLQVYYQKNIPEVTFSQIHAYKLKEVLQNLLFNGWFPLFPWLLFILLGFTFKQYQLMQRFKNAFSLVIGLVILIISIYGLSKSSLFKPDFAVELFYPAQWVYLLFALSFIHVFWFFKPLLKQNIFLNGLQSFGSYSLLLYILHLAALHIFTKQIDIVIQYKINPFFQLGMVFSVLILLMICFWKLILWLKSTKHYPQWRKFLIVRMLFH